MTSARTETIRFRVTADERARFIKAAGGERKLSEWLRTAADERATVSEEDRIPTRGGSLIRPPLEASKVAFADIVPDGAPVRRPAKAPKDEPGRRGGIPGARDQPNPCPHPKNKRESKGYATICGVCKVVIR